MRIGLRTLFEKQQPFSAGQFKEPVFVSAFREHLRGVNAVQVRVFCVLAFTLVPLFSFLDYFTAPHYFWTFVLIRSACATLVFFLFLFSFTLLGKRYINILGAAAPLLVGGAISLMIRYLGGYESSYYAGLNLVMLGVAMLYVWDVRVTAVTCLIIYSSYIIPILVYDQIRHPEIFVNNNAFLLSTMLIALTSAYFIFRLHYREFESRYQMEESRRALQESNEKLKRLGEMKNQFFADISHELRTPLAVIRGEAEVTLRGKEKPVTEYKRVLDYIILLVDQLNKLVSDLLFLARSESGTLQIENREISLQESLKEASREGEVLGLKKGIALRFNERPEEVFFLLGDMQRLKQLFLIVIDNAINYSNAGGEVILSLEREKDRGKITVSDRGVGVPEELLPHLFDRFYRVEKTKSMAQGTGLGLSIAKWIAEAHRGEILITSRVGVGTTVTIYLPLYQRKQV